MQNRRVQIGNVIRFGGGAEAEFIGGADGLAALDARARQPHAEAERIVIAPRPADALAGRRAPKLAAPDQKRFVP